MQNNSNKIQQNKFKSILLYVKRNIVTIILNVLVILFFICIIYNLTLQAQARQKENTTSIISNVATIDQQCLSSSIQENDTYTDIVKQTDEELNTQLEEQISNTEKDNVEQQENQNVESNINTIDNTVQYYDIPLSEDIQKYLFDICNEYSVPVPLMLALIETESNFDTDVISYTDDYGLCQINIINHDHLSEVLGITNIMDPKQNILCSVYILSGHLSYTNGNIQLALMCYNCGQGGAQSLWDQGIYTTDYVDIVMSRYDKYVR